MKGRRSLLLRNAALFRGVGVATEPADVAIAADQVREIGAPGTLVHGSAAIEIDLEGRLLLPAFVNAHDHLDLSTMPPLGTPPYASVYEWTEASAGAGGAFVAAALEVPLVDRLFLGGLRNLLAGATAVIHHAAYHRCLGRPDFPVRVLERYQFAHSPGLTSALRKTYRSTDRRIPWFVHLGEGTDERCRTEVDVLALENLLRHNTVIVHGIALRSEDLPRLAEAGAAVVWCPEASRHLYGAVADVAALRGAGIRIGLGSDSAATGARDALSNLAAARREGAYSDDDLLALASAQSGEVARLPAGRLEAGAPSDLLAVTSIERLLEGDRAAIALVIGAGRPLFGLPALVPGGGAIDVDGERRSLDAPLLRRAHALLTRYPQIRRARWAETFATRVV
jgi:cytosine/adenosine deaminase-related metal-dependent hydrolase